MEKHTKTITGAKARRAVLEGVNAVYDPVKRTLGPHGKSALVPRTLNRGQIITDDGVTVAEWQNPKDPHIRLAAETFKEICKRTVDKVGDGTTTTAVIGGYLYNSIYKTLSDGERGMEFTANGVQHKSVVDIRRSILASAEKVKDAVLARNHTVETLEQLERVSIVSVKDDKLGKLVAGMTWDVGVDGFIDVTEGYRGHIETEVVKGMRFPSKVAAKAFVTNPARFEMVAKDCAVLITNYALDAGSRIAAVLSALNQHIGKVIVIAPSFADNVLVGMTEACKAGYFIYPVAAPGLRTEQFEDLAIYCGAKFFDKNKGIKLENCKKEDLGFIEKIVVKDSDNRDEAVVLGGAGTRVRVLSKMEGEKNDIVATSAVAERIEMLKGQLAEQKQEIYKKLFERRIASMSSGVGVIRVGGSTDAEIRFQMKKIEDCVFASRAALRGGYVKGGGLCLKEIADEVLEEGDVLREAISYPHTLIAQTLPKDSVIGEEVVDPAEAVFWAVEHAAQVVAQLITVDVITAEIDPAMEGDATLEVARMLSEVVISTKRYLGLIRENEEEMERDRLNGLTVDEKIMLDNG